MRVLMFPGQSSADPQMLIRATRLHPVADRLIARARDVLGDRVRRYLVPQGTPLETNRDVQVAVFLATQIHLAALAAEGLECDVSVGLSLGEYSHVVHIEALDFESALHLVDARGSAYDSSPRGMMAAVLAVDGATVEAVVAEATARGVVVISNYNTPTQHVIAGETAAVTWACEQLTEEHLAQTVVIEKHVPMHTPLLSDVARRFALELARATWRAPIRPYLPNVLGSWAPDAGAPDFIAYLTDHVTRAVRWRESLELLFATHPGATFVEAGPGQVLGNMFGRRWIRPACVRTDPVGDHDPADWFRAAVNTLRTSS